MESRAALVGDNGVGKSTLLKLIMNEIEPVTGQIKIHRKAKISRFTQHHMDQLNLEKTPLGWFQSLYPNAKPQDLRKHLGSMGITGKLQLQPIYSLSGGQKSRVAFAHVTYLKPQLLLLDEVCQLSPNCVFLIDFFSSLPITWIWKLLMHLSWHSMHSKEVF